MNIQRMQFIPIARGGAESVLATNKVICNTYMPLSVTLLFATTKLRNSGWGLASITLFISIFNLFTSLLGFTNTGDRTSSTVDNEDRSGMSPT